MSLLKDPTIQRILEEVNKAATGGALGNAGKYLSEPLESTMPFGSDFASLGPTMNQFFGDEDDDAALFYPTPEMFSADGSMNFEPNFNFNGLPATLPIATPNNFDLYNTNIYNTMQRSLPSSYEHYHHISKSHHRYSSTQPHPSHSLVSLSPTHHDAILKPQESTEDSTKSNTAPNAALNIRTPTPPIAAGQSTTKHTETAAPAPPERAENRDVLSSSIPNERLNLSLDSEHLNSAGQIFYDPNPQVIQRKGSHSVTYQQNVIVRFLQPPPIPNVGPLVIKEVRPPQPPPLPPLVIKQRPTPPRTPPPVVIRERPPPLPAACATKVITRQVPPEPAPPRSVIIERLPPLPPKPRDIIIERWLPYEILDPKRKVIVQRAKKSTAEHPPPKNIIITYEPVQAKVVRNFQKQAVTREDPQAYAQRYGSQLYDLTTVLEQARAFGVYEDLNPTSSSTTTSANGKGSHVTVDQPLSGAETNTESSSLDKNTMKQNYEEKTKSHDETPHESMATVATSLAHDDDLLMEPNMTPFYMTSDQSFHQTLERLGIDLENSAMFNATF